MDAGGEERLILAHEINRRSHASVEEIAAAIRGALSEEHEVSVAEVVLLRPETLPRTSSGKIGRRACRSAYLDGSLRSGKIANAFPDESD